jgi:hypothetical protein
MTTETISQRRRGAFLAATFAVAGGATLVVLLVFQDLPSPWWLWVTLAVAFVVLDFGAVEVNDGLMVSASAMVTFTAAVAFGRDSAMLGVVLMAALGLLQPQDLRRRRWREPAANFGQLVLSTAAGISIFTLFLPEGPIEVRNLPMVAVGAAASSVVYDWVNFQLVVLYVRLVSPDRTGRPWTKMITNHLTLMVLASLGGLLGAAYLLKGPTTLPLILVTYAVGHVPNGWPTSAGSPGIGSVSTRTGWNGSGGPLCSTMSESWRSRPHYYAGKGPSPRMNGGWLPTTWPWSMTCSPRSSSFDRWWRSPPNTAPLSIVVPTRCRSKRGSWRRPTRSMP